MARERAIVLTEREREVAALVAAGKTNAGIAADLGIATQTVKSHVAAIFRRTGFTNRAAVAAWWAVASRGEG